MEVRFWEQIGLLIMRGEILTGGKPILCPSGQNEVMISNGGTTRPDQTTITMCACSARHERSFLGFFLMVSSQFERSYEQACVSLHGQGRAMIMQCHAFARAIFFSCCVPLHEDHFHYWSWQQQLLSSKILRLASEAIFCIRKASKF